MNCGANLDDPEAEIEQHEPVVQFKRVNRGAPFTIRVPRGPEMVAARNGDDIEER